jgi:hypothetical protein
MKSERAIRNGSFVLVLTFGGEDTREIANIWNSYERS